MRTRPVGSSALMIEVDHVDAWTSELLQRRDNGEFAAQEIVPGAGTVLLDGVANPAALADIMRTWPQPSRRDAEAGRLIEISTVYDGPDLGDVAERWQMTVDDAIRTHSGIEFRVAFFGFAPGFAYLRGLPLHLAVPRLESPRTKVLPGSVGLADTYAAIYPSASPGGWRLLGRTSEALFDVDSDPPTRFAPGDRVRFVAARR